MYCNYDGAKLIETAPWVYKCTLCERDTYINPAPTVDALLFNSNQEILLVHRNIEPDKGKINLPGGFIEPQETLEGAIARELEEELELDPSFCLMTNIVTSRANLYHYQDIYRPILVFVVVGHVMDFHHMKADTTEISGYNWYKPENLHPEQLTSQSEYDHIMQLVKMCQK